MSLDDEFAVPISATDLNMFALVNVFLGCTPPDIEAKIVRQCSDVNVPLCIIYYIIFGRVDCSGVQQVGITRIIYSRNRESGS